MLRTAAEYRTVNGLNPDINKHLIFADIEPVSFTHTHRMMDWFFVMFHNISVLQPPFRDRLLFYLFFYWLFFGSIDNWLSCQRCKTPTTQHVFEKNQSNWHNRKCENMFIPNCMGGRGMQSHIHFFSFSFLLIFYPWNFFLIYFLRFLGHWIEWRNAKFIENKTDNCFDFIGYRSLYIIDWWYFGIYCIHNMVFHSSESRK